MKLEVVPESSERFTGVTLRSGSVASGFRAAMAGSFQVAISPRKILATVAASRFSSLMSGRLKATAIGEM